MIVHVTGREVALTEVDDFDHFEVRTASVADLDDVLRGSGAGYVVSRDAVVSTEWIGRQARALGIADPAWQARFSDMVGFARSAGWLLDDDTGIRAHVESSSRTA